MRRFVSKAILIISFLSLAFFFTYEKYIKIDTDQETDLENESESFTNSNEIKDIKYLSKDLKGNEYTILAKEGEIDLNNADIIFLTDVTAYIKLNKNNETIKIFSDYGKYNTINYDTIFSKNVNILYLENKITGEYLDFSMLKNLLIISKNVVYTDQDNILKADVIELDTITKNTKIFMHNLNQKVNVQSIELN